MASTSTSNHLLSVPVLYDEAEALEAQDRLSPISVSRSAGRHSPLSRLSFREFDVHKMFTNLRKKSTSDLNLVFDMFRGTSPTDRVSASTGNLHRNRKRISWQSISPNHIQKQIHLVQEEKAMQAAPSQPIDAAKFVAYVTERRKKRILFKGEYLMIQRSIDMQKCRSDVASTMDDRNQYPDTLPYDYNRVILHTMPGDENSHYVNASYVNSWVREKAYVVTQAVKTKAANAEFWRMVWELGSNCIVMLTKVFDFMRVMCAQYWPITSAHFGEIEVETLETKTYAHFVIRTFRLKRLDEYEGLQTRTVKHFHFTEWELDSFPYISAFIELRRRVRQHMEKCFADAPIVVHCRLVF